MRILAPGPGAGQIAVARERNGARVVRGRQIRGERHRFVTPASGQNRRVFLRFMVAVRPAGPASGSETIRLRQVLKAQSGQLCLATGIGIDRQAHRERSAASHRCRAHQRDRCRLPKPNHRFKSDATACGGWAPYSVLSKRSCVRLGNWPGRSDIHGPGPDRAWRFDEQLGPWSGRSTGQSGPP